MQKRILAILLSLVMIVGLMPTAVLAADMSDFPDMPTDYSASAMKAAVSNGLYKGSDGKLMPNANLSRAEMVTIINRAFGAVNEADISAYIDIPSDAWYYDDIAKAVAMKTLIGDDKNLINPNVPITREQAFAVIARALKLDDGTSADITGFSDADTVSSWAKGYVAAMVRDGYVCGYEGKLNPLNYITRKDFAVVMDNVIKTYITDPADIPALSGNVMINVPDVTLSNKTVEGDLIIGDGVGNGDITLDNVKITGKLIIRGGGINSIIIKGNSSIGGIVIAKVDGDVRVHIDGAAQAGVIIVADGKNDVKLEGNIETLEVTGEVSVILNNANAENVIVSASNAKVTVIGGTKVISMTVDKAAAGASIEAAAGTAITNISSNAQNVTVTGKGSVENVNVNGNNTAIDTAGTKVEVAEGITGTIAGETAIEGGSNIITPGVHSSGNTNKPSAPAHTHSYSEVITRPATCTVTGEKTLSCDCGDVKTEVIPVIAHSWETTVQDEVKCTIDGVKVSTCTECSEQKTEVINATGHSWGDDYIDDEEAGRCTAATLHKCSTCQTVEQVSSGASIHTLGGWTADGENHVRRCSTALDGGGACSYTETAPHSYGDWSSENLTGTRTCADCGYIQTKGARIGITYYSDMAAALTAAASGSVIELADGTYAFPSVSAGKDITFKGGKDAVFNFGSGKYGAANTTITFDGVTVDWHGGESYQGIQNAAKVIYKNCKINGLQYMYGECEFIGCTFENEQCWSVWTYGARNAAFTDCTFNTGGHAVLIYNEESNSNFVANVAFTRCTFNNSGTVSEQWGHEDLVETGTVEANRNGDGSNKYNLTFTDCTVTGADTQNLWGNKNNLTQEHLSVIVNGADVY